MIKLVRIDYRLLHGQVVFSWTKSQGINRIIVINKEAATDEFKKMSLNLAKPTGVKLNIFTDGKQFGSAIFLNEEEQQEARKLKEMGVKQYMQQIPTSKSEDLNKLI